MSNSKESQRKGQPGRPDVHQIEFEQAATDHHQSFIDGLQELQEAFNSNDDTQIEAAEQESRLYSPLCVEESRLIDVTFGTGGPADGVEIRIDSEGDIESVKLWYQDWFKPRHYYSVDKEYWYLFEIYAGGSAK
jgi:hypothetical protein